MPSTENLLAQRLTPGQQTMRQYYQGRLALELAQGASIELNRRLLRRGARKMQDGTLGQSGEPTEEEPVNISIGDTYQVMPATVAATPVPTAPAGSSVSHAVPAASATGGTETAASAANQVHAVPASTSRWKQAAAIAAVLASMGGSAGVASWLTSRSAQQPAAGQQIAIPGYGVQVEKQLEAKK